MTAVENAGFPVLILAPIGRDAPLAAEALARVGIASEIFTGLAQLTERVNDDTGAVLLAKEALIAPEVQRFITRLSAQAAWSDLPLLVLTNAGHIEDASVRILNLLGPNANVTLIERPMRINTLISVVRVALRARRRQYEARDLIEQRETVLASISDAFSAIDHDWRYTYVNDRVALLAGLPKEQMVGRNIWEIFPEFVGTEFYLCAHEAMVQRRAVQLEYFHEPWRRWLDTRIYPTKSGIIIFRADITARKEQELLTQAAEAKLHESEDRLRLATEAAAIGTFDYYPQTGELRLSARARKLLGIAPAAEVDNEKYLASIHPEDRPIALETAERMRQASDGERYDIEYRTAEIPDGQERWVAEMGRVLLDANGHASRFVGTFLDITERKTSQLALQRAKQQAEEANRAKDHFLAMLSHELRTPLTPVLMTIASLRRQPDVSGELQSDLEVLQRNVELEALLIDDLLDLTRIAHGKLELHRDAVDVHHLLEHALAISKAEVDDKELIVTPRFEAAEHHTWGDGARLQQVFWNLVKNAAKFTPAGGRLDISTHNDEAQRIVVEVTDNGVGIGPELLPRIFDAFEQGGRNVTSQFGGLGLGLAISKKVVDLHGGTIGVTSPGQNQGATFTVTLQAMETSLLDAAVATPAETPTTASMEILLVEDHEDTAHVLRRILAHAGYLVSRVSTVAEAREQAGEKDFDLVVSDVGLPDGSGLDLMRFLQKERGLRGIALSGFGTEDDRAASLAAGFSAHLTKPVDWPQLRGAIERVLAAGVENPPGADLPQDFIVTDLPGEEK